jgi:hypothetical protein
LSRLYAWDAAGRQFSLNGDYDSGGTFPCDPANQLIDSTL